MLLLEIDDHWNTPTETLRMECQGGRDKPGLFAISIIPTGWKSSWNRNLKISDDSQHPNEPNLRKKHRTYAVSGWLCSSHQGLSNKPKIVEIQSQDPKLALRAGTLLCHITRFGGPCRNSNEN